MNESGPVALLFPGQGSHRPGMRESVEELRPDLLELVEGEFDRDPFEHAAETTEDAQLAIFCTGLASLTRWHREGALNTQVLAYAGHSLGELTALTAAGCLSERDALRLVGVRGQLMQRACEQEPGGMLAVLGKGASQARAFEMLLGLTVANDNAPDQLVLSGDHRSLDTAAAACDGCGIRTVRLPVAGAFHSPAMRHAVPEFERAVRRTSFTASVQPVMCGATAQPFSDIPAQLAASLVHPVRWRETLQYLRLRGIRRFVEAGPGRVLTGLVTRTLDDVTAAPVDARRRAAA